MLRFLRTLRENDRGAVVVETLLMFVLMMAFIAATTRTMKLHANNQQAYMEAHRKALLNVMGAFDISSLAGQLDPLNPPPEVPTWSEDYLEEDLSGMLAEMSDHSSYSIRGAKLVAGHEGRTMKLFNTDAFGLSNNPTDIDLEHVVYMMRPPWTFGGFPAVPGEDPFFEATEVRKAIGEMIDEELVGTKVVGTPLREYLKMKPIWYKPITFQAGKPGSY